MPGHHRHHQISRHPLAPWRRLGRDPLVPMCRLGGDPLVAVRRLALGAALLLWSFGAAAADTIEGVAAQVGSDVVLLSEVYQTASPVASQVANQGGSPEDLAQVHEEALDRLIERALIRQVVKRAELAASDTEVDGAIQGIASENDITVDELRNSVEAQGLSYEDYRDKIRDEIEQSKVIQGMVTSRIRLDEDELREIYEADYASERREGLEVRVRQILVPRAADPNACATVAAARERVMAGEPFDLVASQTSYVNRKEGGDLGWTPARDLVEWMRELAENLPTGSMSEVVELDHACSILVVEGRRDASERSFSDVRDEIANKVRGRESEAKYREFIEDMRERTYIDRRTVFDPNDFKITEDASTL